MKTETIRLTPIQTSPVLQPKADISPFRHEGRLPDASHKKHAGLKDPGSAITHLIGGLLAAAAAPLLLLRAYASDSGVHLFAMAVFMASMILLYTASTVYHAIDKGEKINQRLKKLDHTMISVLIAGTYTPVCMITLAGRTGTLLLTLIWALAAAGIIFKIFWVNCPKWISSVLYIGMGWLCILALPQLLAKLSGAAFAWLLAGGLMYTIGGVIYALKLQLFNHRHKNFGSHEIFHLFVMAGSFCHFMFMYLYVA